MKGGTQKHVSHKQSTNINNMILVTILLGIREWIESGQRVGSISMLADIDIVIQHLKDTKPRE